MRSSANERIVATEVYEVPGAQEPPEGEAPVSTVTFTESDGRTILTILVQTTSKELRDTIVDSGMEAGMQEQMDALERIATSLR